MQGPVSTIGFSALDRFVEASMRRFNKLEISDSGVVVFQFLKSLYERQGNLDEISACCS
jgi:hypothetical protein